MSGLGIRALGSTGLSVSRIGLGLAALGRPAYINLGRDQDYGRARSATIMERRLNLYHIHSATIESGVLNDERVLDELGRLRAEGLAIGLTVTGPKQGDAIRRALDVNARRGNLFQVVQATWNLLEPSAGPALADAKALGLGVIVKEAVANGRLTDLWASPNITIARP